METFLHRPKIRRPLKRENIPLGPFSKKVLVPKFNTVWHFESKLAQRYFLEHLQISTPETIASFDYEDASNRFQKTDLPLVFKESFGASSENVRLVSNSALGNQFIQKIFSQALWDKNKAQHNNWVRRILSAVHKRGFWAKVRQKVRRDERFGMILW